MLIQDFHNFNYLEINILKNNNNYDDKDKIIDLNWDEEEFNKKLLYFIRNKNKYKPFEKKFSIKKYLNKTLLYSKDEEKYNVFEINFIDKIINKSNIIIKYQKKNLPVVNFPSTNNLNEELLINRITFKVTNRIYINFELSKKEIINNDNKEFKIFRRIYINFNNDKNDKIDQENINNLLNKCINYF